MVQADHHQTCSISSTHSNNNNSSSTSCNTGGGKIMTTTTSGTSSAASNNGSTTSPTGCASTMETFNCTIQYINDADPFNCSTLFPEPRLQPPIYNFNLHLPLINQLPSIHRILRAPHRLDESTLQLYKDGDYGSYLDLEASISEQQEDFEGFLNNRKNSIVLRAQLPVRVNSIIEKLLTADGRELRGALISLKQIFQEDKDLVHEFVENDGLACLIKVGSEADQTYQNYILRALGQIMLYVDGMYGVMGHNETIQWLYTLVGSKFQSIQKTALKLLLVFVEYVESNCLLLIEAIHSVDSMKGSYCWSLIMSLLQEQQDSSSSTETELLTYAMTLINKVLNGIPDIDTYYDQIDSLEEQGMATIIQKFMGKQCADLDFIQQLQIYEVVLKHEDCNEPASAANGGGDGHHDGCDELSNVITQLDPIVRQKLLNRKGYIELTNGGGGGSYNGSERRKSRRRDSLNITPLSIAAMQQLQQQQQRGRHDSDGSWSTTISSGSGSSSPSSSSSPASSIIHTTTTTPQPQIITSTPIILNGFKIHEQCGDSSSSSSLDDLTPGLRKRRERRERQKILVSEQLNGHGASVPSSASASANEKSAMLLRENTVKDLTQKLVNQHQQSSTAAADDTSTNNNKRIGDLTGIISKAKEGLAKSKSKLDLIKQQQSNLEAINGGLPGINGAHSAAFGTSPSSTTGPAAAANGEQKKSDNELHWDFLVTNLNRSLEICDLDFTELKADDDVDIISPYQLCNISMNSGATGTGTGSPPVAPAMNGFGPPPPPPPAFTANSSSSPNVPAAAEPPPPPPPTRTTARSLAPSKAVTTCAVNKTKKTVKLFWKEIRDLDPSIASKIENVGSIWDELTPISLDTGKLEHLFESRAKDLMAKKQQEVTKFKEIVVLDPKRSNAINIGMTKLPPPRTIKTAILKMDATIINREGIEKLLTMLPTDEERAKIQEAQFANPETPLGSAEQFLLTLASISELTARLKLWAFKLDYENLEKEIAEPLMDLKLGIEILQKNKTFKFILSTLLSIGNFLNGNEAKGFQIDYLEKLPEVKDTVYKHSLLHHLCHTVIEKFPDSSDLYSEIGPVTRASRVEFDELASNLIKMENDCKTSWDYLRLIAKYDGPTNMKLKMSEFLADTAERIIVLQIIHRRVMIRFHKFLLWLGVSAHQVTTTKPHALFKIISEFALEYRTTRDRVLQQLQKKVNHRERNKTRGKMITEQILSNGTSTGTGYSKAEDKADAELRQVLSLNSNGLGGGGPNHHGSSARRNSASSNNTLPKYTNGSAHKPISHNYGRLLDGDGDEILESLVKTATQTPAKRPGKQRSNSRYTGRKSLRRTLRYGLSEKDRTDLAAFMAANSIEQ